MKNNKKKLKLYEADTTADAKGVRGYNAFIKPSDVSKYRAQLTASVKRTTGYIMLKEELKKLIKEEMNSFLKEARQETRFDRHDGNKYLKVGTRYTFDKTATGAKDGLMDFSIDRNWDGVSNHGIMGEASAKKASEFQKELLKLARDFEKGVDNLRGKHK